MGGLRLGEQTRLRTPPSVRAGVVRQDDDGNNIQIDGQPRLQPPSSVIGGVVRPDDSFYEAPSFDVGDELLQSDDQGITFPTEFESDRINVVFCRNGEPVNGFVYGGLAQ